MKGCVCEYIEMMESEKEGGMELYLSLQNITLSGVYESQNFHVLCYINSTGRLGAEPYGYIHQSRCGTSVHACINSSSSSSS